MSTPRYHAPFVVEVTRSGIVESRHRGSAVVTDADGAIVAAWGDPDRPTFPRSANKPLQALPLVETGAADRFGIEPRLIAFACASHQGEAFHAEAAAGWLARVGLTADALECGAHLPYAEDSAAALIRGGTAPTALYNNCSGKHSGMLCHTVHCEDAPAGYVGASHPTQGRVTDALRALCGMPADAPMGIDGCGIPTFAIALKALAKGMAALADSTRQPPLRAAALARIADAMAAHPEMVSGTDQFVTRAMQVAGSSALVKSGAEGVFTGVLRQRGWGFALKIEDGAGRAAEVACAQLLRRFGALDDAQAEQLQGFATPVLRNRAGVTVGGLRAEFGAGGTF